MFIYLASPYSNDKESNFLKTEAFTAAQMKCGLHIFSPIVHCHEMATKYEMPTRFSFWKAYNYGMLDAASALWVLCLPGWNESEGVHAEIDRARERGIPVVYVPFKAAGNGREFVPADILK